MMGCREKYKGKFFNMHEIWEGKLHFMYGKNTATQKICKFLIMKLMSVVLCFGDCLLINDANKLKQSHGKKESLIHV